MRINASVALALCAIACSDARGPESSTDEGALTPGAALPVRTLVRVPGDPTLVGSMELGDKSLFVWRIDDTRAAVLEAYDLATGAKVGQQRSFVLNMAASPSGIVWSDNVGIWVADAALGGARVIANQASLVTAIAADDSFVYTGERSGPNPGAFVLRRYPLRGGAPTDLFSGFGDVVGLYPAQDRLFVLDSRTTTLVGEAFPYLASTLFSVSFADGATKVLAPAGMMGSGKSATLSASAQGFAFANRVLYPAFDPTKSDPVAMVNTPTQAVFVDPAGTLSSSLAGPACFDVKTDGRSLYCLDTSDATFAVIRSAKNGASPKRLAIQHLPSAYGVAMIGVRGGRLFFAERDGNTAVVTVASPG
jgi:hypothetical protein